MTLIVASIFEDDLSVGKIMLASSWQDAYTIAEGLIRNLYMSQKGIDISLDTGFIQEIQEDLQNNDYHLLWSAEERSTGNRSQHTDGNGVAVQICATEN
jgi:hypothetical protein